MDAGHDSQLFPRYRARLDLPRARWCLLVRYTSKTAQEIAKTVSYRQMKTSANQSTFHFYNNTRVNLDVKKQFSPLHTKNCDYRTMCRQTFASTAPVHKMVPGKRRKLNKHEKKTGNKQLRFEMTSDNKIVERKIEAIAPIEPEQHSLLWWQPSDLDDIHRSARHIVCLVREGSCDQRRELAFKSTYAETLIKVHEVCQKDGDITRSLKHSISLWVAMGDERRGLEKCSIPKLGSERRVRRNSVIQNVLRAQRICKERGLIPDVTTQLLRNVSIKRTIPHVRFAEIMAVADTVGSRIEAQALHTPPPTVPTKAATCPQKQCFSSRAC